MNRDPALRALMVKNFGEEVYVNEVLNRKYLADIVFNDPDKLSLLNSLTHPQTIQNAAEWMNKQTSPYIIKEAALLFESGADKGLDHVIGVSAPLPVRIKRVMERDKLTKEEVMKRINRQMDEETKMKRCDFLVINDEKQMVIPQVLALTSTIHGRKQAMTRLYLSWPSTS